MSWRTFDRGFEDALEGNDRRSLAGTDIDYDYGYDMGSPRDGPPEPEPEQPDPREEEYRRYLEAEFEEHVMEQTCAGLA